MTSLISLHDLHHTCHDVSDETDDIYPCGMGVRIQPTPALLRVGRGDYLRDMSCPLPPAHCMQGLLACNGAYELG